MKHTEERFLALTAEIVERLDGASVIDPGAMREHMEVVGPMERTYLLRIDGSGRGGDAVASAPKRGPSVLSSSPSAPPPSPPLQGSLSAAASTSSPPMTRTHHLMDSMCTSLITCASSSSSSSIDSLVAAASASSRILLINNGIVQRSVVHRGVEALAFYGGGSLLLSCGADGCVRVWPTQKAGEGSGNECSVIDLNGVDATADRMPDGCSVVQCVAASSSGGDGDEMAAAACGASILTLHPSYDRMTAPSPPYYTPPALTEQRLRPAVCVRQDERDGGTSSGGESHRGNSSQRRVCLGGTAAHYAGCSRDALAEVP